MYFVALCEDKPNSLEIRAAQRPAHRAFWEANMSRVKVGGPLFGADNQTMIGSMFVLEADNEAGARALLAEDPFSKFGLFESVRVMPWRWTLNAPA